MARNMMSDWDDYADFEAQRHHRQPVTRMAPSHHLRSSEKYVYEDAPPSLRRSRSYGHLAPQPRYYEVPRRRSPSPPLELSHGRDIRGRDYPTPGVMVYPPGPAADELSRSMYRPDLTTSNNTILRSGRNDLSRPGPPPAPYHTHRTYTQSTSQIDKERLFSRESEYSLSRCDTIWSTSMTRDVTIHMDMDVEEDVQGQLDEFIQYQNIGNFKAAQKYVADHLAHVSEDLSVGVQYADMLANQGAHRLLMESISSDDMRALYEALEFRSVVPSGEKLKLLLIFHKAASIVNKSGYLPWSFSRIARNYCNLADAEGLWEDPSATDVDVIKLLHESNNLDFAIRVDWPTLYSTLLEQKRPWDLWKTYGSLSIAHGPIESFRILTGEATPKEGLEKLLEDWNKMAAGEAGFLALLDILTSALFAAALRGARHEGVAIFHDFEKSLQEKARLVASLVKDHAPKKVQSRPYIHWIIAEESVARLSGEGFHAKHQSSAGGKNRSELPGTFLQHSLLPLYAPREAENPGWPVESSAKYENGLLEVALRATERSGDYLKQRMCLQELICRSVDPEELFKKLEQLDKEATGQEKQLETLLSKYLLVKDDASREALRKDLIELDPRLRSGPAPTTSLEWCRLRVLRALSISLGLNAEIVQDLEQRAIVLEYRPARYPYPAIQSRSRSRIPDVPLPPEATERRSRPKHPYVESDPDDDAGERREPIVVINTPHNVAETPGPSTLQVPGGGVNKTRSRSVSRERPRSRSRRRSSLEHVPVVQIIPRASFGVPDYDYDEWEEVDYVRGGRPFERPAPNITIVNSRDETEAETKARIMRERERLELEALEYERYRREEDLRRERGISKELADQKARREAELDAKADLERLRGDLEKAKKQEMEKRERELMIAEEVRRAVAESLRQQATSSTQIDQVKKGESSIGPSSVNIIGNQVRELIKAFVKVDLPEIVKDFQTGIMEPEARREKKLEREKRQRQKARREKRRSNPRGERYGINSSDSYTSSYDSESTEILDDDDDVRRAPRRHYRDVDRQERRQNRGDPSSTALVIHHSRVRHHGVEETSKAPEEDSHVAQEPAAEEGSETDEHELAHREVEEEDPEQEQDEYTDLYD